jgi:hypothetical protein
VSESVKKRSLKRRQPLTDTMATVRTPKAGSKPSDKTPSPKVSQPSSSSQSSVRRSIGEWELKQKSRTQEAKNCLRSAKRYLEQSRNLRIDIKDGVNAALNKLFQLVKEADDFKE